IAARLMKAGRKPSEPVAIISKATTDQQSVVVTCLAEAATAAREARIEPPAIIVIGPTVALRAELDWLSPNA
ncbi:MAG TPA: uroporphyrinogen-III C-methyltransferase, partial [Stellaceae bacterium]|nr:uroporphyrinogen-III C-methyltransferase [Stellaceae bacterium]